MHDCFEWPFSLTYTITLDDLTMMFADLSEKQASDCPLATISAYISTSIAKPDMVLVSGAEYSLLELTVPFNSSEALAAAI